MSPSREAISIVLPTYNRLRALRETIPGLLAMNGVSEVVVVVDGSSDGTTEWLQDLAEPRLVVLVQENQGSPAARNRGVSEARSPWILMTEDDCALPVDFATTLLAVALERDAQIVGAPWMTLDAGVPEQDEIARRRANARRRIGLRTHPGVFPLTDLETPFLNGIYLAARRVFDTVQYHGYGGNAWREETDLFLTANAAGLRSVLTPRTASVQRAQWSGGQRRSRLRYEAWIAVNEWHFLRRHARQLRALGEIRSPVRAEAAFVMSRVRMVATGFAQARWSGLRARG